MLGKLAKRGKQKHNYAQCQYPWEGLRCQEGPLVGGGRNAHTSVTETRPAGGTSLVPFPFFPGSRCCGSCGLSCLGFWGVLFSLHIQFGLYKKKRYLSNNTQSTGPANLSLMLVVPKTCSCWKVPVNKEAFRHSCQMEGFWGSGVVKESCVLCGGC